jgi:hypothetical protein
MKKAKDILLSEKISKLRTKRDTFVKKIDRQIYEKQNELRKICTHSKITVREDNHAGGYLHTATYNKITECKICDTELKRITTNGGYA